MEDPATHDITGREPADAVETFRRRSGSVGEAGSFAGEGIMTGLSSMADAIGTDLVACRECDRLHREVAVHEREQPVVNLRHRSLMGALGHG